jgi:KDO2-lipid IV(A) lauroyltransferase
MSKKKQKNILVVYFEYLIFLCAVFVFKLVPLRIAYFLADILSYFIYIFDFKHRNRIIKHLMFVGICKDKKSASVLAKENLRQFIYLGLEIVKAKQYISMENAKESVRMLGSEKSKKMFFSPDVKNNSNAIVLTAHYGNWELAGLLYVAHSGHTLTSVMRDFDNPLIGNYFVKQRKEERHFLCSKKNALLSLMKALKRNESACMLVDQHANRNEGVETLFWGKPARTHASPAILHLRTGVPILLALVKRIGFCKFEIYIADPIIYKSTGDKEKDIQALAQLYTTELEKLIKKAGIIQWLWAHRRWLDLRKKTIRSNQKKQNRKKGSTE